MMAPRPRGITLRITGPDGRTFEAHPEMDSIILGSGADAAVRLTDPRVSPTHVMLKVTGVGGITAIDLSSEAGTRLGSQRIHQPVLLSSGDVLNLGTTRVEVLFGSAGPPAKVHLEETVRVLAPRAPPQPQVQRQARVEPQPLARAPARAPSTGPLPTHAPRVLQVEQRWGHQVLAIRQFKAGQTVTIGGGPGSTFPVFSASVGKRFKLFTAGRAPVQVRLPSDARLALQSEQGHQGAAALVQEGRLVDAARGAPVRKLELAPHETLFIGVGNTTLTVRAVHSPSALPAAAMAPADRRFFAGLGGSLLLAGVLVAAMSRVPHDSESASPRPASSAYLARLVHLERKVAVEKRSASAELAKAKEAEGEAGSREAKKAASERRGTGDPKLVSRRREQNLKKVMSAGLLAAFGGPGAANAKVFSPGSPGGGINAALVGLKTGTGSSDARGMGGLSSRGAGARAGGTGLGMSGLGTQRAGGTGLLDLGGGKEVARVVPGKTTVVGGLAKEVIAKVIRRHQSEIKFCYEKELQKDAALSGKVALTFTIDGTGAVSRAEVAESSLNSSTAEACMLARVRRWAFPEPEGGGLVTVTFPWVFKPAGSSNREE